MMARKRGAPRIWRKTLFRSTRVNRERLPMIAIAVPGTEFDGWMKRMFLEANPGLAEVLPEDVYRSEMGNGWES